jgi:beta-lactamase regulating signal transducer with metallopeptidase domain
MPSILGSGFPALAIELAGKSLLLLIVILSATWFMRRFSAAVRHLYLTMATVSLVVLPFGTILLPSWDLGLLSEPPGTRAEPAVAAIADSAFESVANDQSGTATSASRSREKVLGWSLGLWAAGAAVLLFGLLGAKFYATWAARSATIIEDDHLRHTVEEIAGRLGLRRAIPVLESDRFQVPCVSGALRPRLVLPFGARSWPSERLEAILRHELAHVRRSDNLVQFLAQIACCMYWPNPLAWILERRLFIERERACDDTVLRQDVMPSDYAHYLMEVMEEMNRTRRTPWLAVAMAEGTDFKDRILSVLNPVARRAAPARRHLVSAIVLCLLVVLPLAALSPWTSTAEVREHDRPTPAPAGRHVSDAPPLDDSVLRALIEALSDETAKVREHAATALGGHRDERAVLPLCRVLLNDREARVREHAAEALGQIGDDRAAEALAVAMRTDPDERVRRHAAMAIGQLAD